MKKILTLLLACAMLLSLAACGSSTAAEPTAEPAPTEEPAAETAAPETPAPTAEPTPEPEAAPAVEETSTSNVEQQVFECDSVKITVTGMNMLTSGQDAGMIGLTMLIEAKTDQSIILPAFTEVWPGAIIRFDDYAMGRKDGDSLRLNDDGSATFSHTWDIQDEATGEVVDQLSMEVIVPKDLVDAYKENGGALLSDPANDPLEPATETAVDDELIKVIVDLEKNTKRCRVTGVTVTNQSGKSLYISRHGNLLHDNTPLANGEEIALGNSFNEANQESGTTVIAFSLFDPNDRTTIDNDGTYQINGKTYCITISSDGTVDYEVDDAAYVDF